LDNSPESIFVNVFSIFFGFWSLWSWASGLNNSLDIGRLLWPSPTSPFVRNFGFCSAGLKFVLAVWVLAIGGNMLSG
jgi:hypothetical protein